MRAFARSLVRMRGMLLDVLHPSRVVGRLLWAAFIAVVALHGLLAVVVLASSLTLLKWNPPVTALMIWRRVTAHQTERPLRFVPLRRIPRDQRWMVIRLEDHHFYTHIGVDFGALRDAWETNAALGRAVVGGSTIPMQLARNLFLTPRKTYLRKYLEVLIAVEMSQIIPKNRVLELYLNYIEWGRGIFGIGAAARFYYGSLVDHLDLDEQRRLATIITNPLRYNVNTFPRSAQMAERYAYLRDRFPDPVPVPASAEEAPLSEQTPPVAQAPLAPGQVPLGTTWMPNALPPP